MSTRREARRTPSHAAAHDVYSPGVVVAPAAVAKPTCTLGDAGAARAYPSRVGLALLGGLGGEERESAGDRETGARRIRRVVEHSNHRRALRAADAAADERCDGVRAHGLLCLEHGSGSTAATTCDALPSLPKTRVDALSPSSPASTLSTSALHVSKVTDGGRSDLIPSDFSEADLPTKTNLEKSVGVLAGGSKTSEAAAIRGAVVRIARAGVVLHAWRSRPERKRRRAAIIGL